jgi:hypothetical protein
MSFINWLLSLLSFNGASRKFKRDGQQVFAGFLAYDWSRQSYGEVREYVNSCVRNGFTGITFELMERLADWPRGEQVADLDKRMQEQVDKIRIWISECRRAGLWARIIVNNSNADVNRTLNTPAIMTRAIDRLWSLYGENQILILPVSERDSDLNSGVRVAIINHAERLYSAANTIAYADKRPDAKWLERHMKDPTIPADGGWSTIAVSDTGDILRKLHEDGVTGQKAKPEQWEAFVRTNLSRGASVCCYAFHKKANLALLDKLGKIIKETVK